MTKTITVSDDTYNKIKDQILEENKKQEEVKTFEIMSRWRGVKYTSKKATNLTDAVKEANLKGANLKGADFYKTNFYGKGGNTKISKEQINDFFKALGIIIVD